MIHWIICYSLLTAHDQPRPHGYSKKGQRCYGIKNWHNKARTNAIGALLGATLLTVSLFDANGFFSCSRRTGCADIFQAWATQDLIPKLPPRSVILLDNATFHHRKDFKDTIQNAGHRLHYLPPYSPDLKPIENKWVHAKKLDKNTNALSIKSFKNKIFESFYMARAISLIFR